MKRSIVCLTLTFTCALAVVSTACGDDDADDLGVGAACSAGAACGEPQTCLTEFKGGYCGLSGCTASSDCPAASACVVHTNGTNYCFRTCLEKVDCNANRSVDAEANCVSSVVFASGKKESKVCEPPGS